MTASNIKAMFICPMNLDRLTGTPIRAKTVIEAASQYADVVLISQHSTSLSVPSVKKYDLGNKNFFAFLRASLALLNTERPALIHGIGPISVLPMLAYRTLHPRTKIIYEVHGWAWYEQEHSPLWKRSILTLFDYLGLWGGDVVIAVSHSEKRFLGRRTFNSKRIRVMWEPVDFICTYTPLPGSGVVVGYIGNAAWYQGLSHIIDAAKLLQDKHDISFRLAGFDASNTSIFPRLSNIEYVGTVERKNVIEFLQSCDIHVSSRIPAPVSDLQFPHKLAEYLAAGRSVIVSTASDQPMVVKEAACGYIADPLSGHSIAQAILAYAKLPADARKKQGEGAIEFVRKHLYRDVLRSTIATMYAELTP